MRRLVQLFPLFVTGAFAVACGSESSAPGASGGTGGGAGTAGSAGTNATGGTGGGGTCAPRTAATMGVHVIMQVTWPPTLGTNAGGGPVNVWTRSKTTVDANNNITAVNNACGSVIPDISGKPIACAGGCKIKAEFPDALWDQPTMPQFTVTGTQTGLQVGGAVNMDANPVLIGLTMADPNGAWPGMLQIQGADSDGDGNLGITSIPKNTGGYSAPPVAALSPLHADKLYIASRTTTSLSGTWVSCDEQNGAANVTAFDNHIIGCHVLGGGECTQAQFKFIDDNRTVYTVTGATYISKRVDDNATCADVRAALPAQ